MSQDNKNSIPKFDLSTEDGKKALSEGIEKIINKKVSKITKPITPPKNLTGERRDRAVKSYNHSMKFYNKKVNERSKKFTAEIQDLIKKSTGTKVSKDYIKNYVNSNPNKRQKQCKNIVDQAAQKYTATTRLQKAKKALSEAVQEIKAVLQKFNMTDKGQTTTTEKEVGGTGKSANEKRARS